MECCMNMCRADCDPVNKPRSEHHPNCPEYNKKKPRYKLSPELCDGDHWTIADTADEVLEAVRAWAGNANLFEDVDDGFEVSVIMMSDKEVDEMPEI